MASVHAAQALFLQNRLFSVLHQLAFKTILDFKSNCKWTSICQSFFHQTFFAKRFYRHCFILYSIH